MNPIQSFFIQIAQKQLEAHKAYYDNCNWSDPSAIAESPEWVALEKKIDEDIQGLVNYFIAQKDS